MNTNKEYTEGKFRKEDRKRGSPRCRRNTQSGWAMQANKRQDFRKTLLQSQVKQGQAIILWLSAQRGHRWPWRRCCLWIGSGASCTVMTSVIYTSTSVCLCVSWHSFKTPNTDQGATGSLPMLLTQLLIHRRHSVKTCRSTWTFPLLESSFGSKVKVTWERREEKMLTAAHWPCVAFIYLLVISTH